MASLKEEIIKAHDRLIDKYGGLKGILDEGRLDSSLQQPFSGFGDYEFYPGYIKKGSRICFNLIKNHCFIDGNKRIGNYALKRYLSLNGYSLNMDDKKLRDLILNIAKDNIGFEEFSNIISENVTKT